MLKAVIFDMDGLLIDSEPYWRKAEIVAFGAVGLQLTEEMCIQTMGLRIDEVVEYWYKKTPWEGMGLKEMEIAILDELIRIIGKEGKLMAGVEATLEFFKNKGFKIGLASSSPFSLIEALVEQLGIRQYFEVLCSAETEEYGKPHPAVYISTAKKLGVKPQECLAFEDSVTGTLSAKSGRMKAIAVPDPDHFDDPRFAIADLKLHSLTEFSVEVFEGLKRL